MQTKNVYPVLRFQKLTNLYILAKESEGHGSWINTTLS